MTRLPGLVSEAHRTPFRRAALALVASFVPVAGCAGTVVHDAPKAPAAVSTAPSASAPPVVSSAPPVTSASASASAPRIDPCAVGEPKVLVTRDALVAAFDVGADGKLTWAEYDPMKNDADVMTLDTTKAGAAPERLAHVPLRGHPSELVVGREGVWLAVDDLTGGTCNTTVGWLARDATRVVTVGAAGCVSGPRRTDGSADATWTTSKALMQPSALMVAKGAPPGGVSRFAAARDASLDETSLTRDGVFVVGDHGEVFLLGNDGAERRVVPPRGESFVSRRAVAVHGQDVYVATSKGKDAVSLVRAPLAGGPATMTRSFPLTPDGLSLQATARGAVLLVHGKEDRMMLVDPKGACADAELALPDRRRHVVVQGDAVWVLRKSQILVTSLAGR